MSRYGHTADDCENPNHSHFKHKNNGMDMSWMFGGKKDSGRVQYKKSYSSYSNNNHYHGFGH